jgi:15-cis-phytoene synthase
MPADAPVADPERALVLAYAPARARAALAALWRLDERLGGVVAAAREPMIGAIRLAWWREALEALDHAPPPPEPLLVEIAATLLPEGISGKALAEIEAGWAALLQSDPPDDDAIENHGRLRGWPLFFLAARLLAGAGCEQAGRAGEGWALADLGSRLSDPAAAARANARAAAVLRELTGFRWPAALRPLGALAMLARQDATSPQARRQGSPARLARIMFHRLTGR